ncbi:MULTISPECIES: Hcp family type VI secretion system effector [Nitrospirillum]|uniref:Hcp1 family type VI secretion system effector n=2 Tax=Nitrospirillum TaxID=1543705 RepID=A0A248K316_9PROT|nr:MULTISPECIES: type VI secretion system tube protein Hcp [Nitrospirillum]ASG25156.1 Hcp1 family type VI secretion system effector [Nitrospirillum amazonense CBAmc]MDG3442737.1 type VI secretion system tube protein Hcp [Nitrospirillum amazonense]MEA1649109.1 type VI secretion system tube protein Hcp [Nitrospirillum sp. BR 11164]MEA1673594.1 type VI secretion system tube protein Hcp [Nitrospirillum sp. BR 11163]MEC4592374.1 type VI secretion system tube protein Hcp [Nitrospirillum amazonense]
MPIYLQIDGISGDATQQNHQQWTDIKTLQWGVTRSMNTLAGATANREGSEPSVREVVLTKTSDSSSVKLFSQACSGRSGVTAKIHIVTSGNPGDTYIEFTLTNTLISSYNISASSDRPEEQIVLNFTKVEMKYTPYDSQHNPQSPIIASYDLATTKSA